ncbi:alpha/beta hydrolase [Lysobacter soli]|uniref:alpha/beta hydrolase n=1 Tax=Lysobacter soli TaxID=453783 RepID=UPI0024107B88|nr:alpha/beta hydrolase [Lysobacter soli]MDG2517141.1 alpha/beta hydrolase [Lysobacter soli]
MKPGSKTIRGVALACLLACAVSFSPVGAVQPTVVMSGATSAIATGVPGAHVLRDIAYGDHPRQRFDLYLPVTTRRAPLIVIVHGGAWANGDKNHPGLIPEKARHWLPRGYALLSTNYRLVPDASPLDQVRDVAQALAHVKRHAGDWKIDADNIVLLGHSAGAHLVALLAASPDLRGEAQANSVRGAILLDSAAYDVQHVMGKPHPALYDRAFGSDPDDWRAASPFARLSRGAPPMLAVCSTGHLRAACEQAHRFARRAADLDVRVDVLPQDLSHMEINRHLGRPSSYTERIDAFLDHVLAGRGAP